MDIASGFFIATAASTWVIFGVASACSSVRYLIQKQYFGQLLWEDYIHLAAWIQCLAYMIVFQLYVGTYLYFFFVSSTPDEAQEFYFDMSTVQGSLYWSTIWTSKAVFLALYRRIFGVSRMYRIAWWITVVITVLAGLAGFLSQFFYCGGNPAHYQWNNPDCIAVKFPWLSIDLYILSLACNAGTDFLIMLLPLYMICKMQMRRSKKARLVPVFMLAWITIIVDVLAWAFQIQHSGNNLYLYYVSLAFIGLEPPITVLIASLPAILFAKVRRSELSKRRRESRPGRGPVQTGVEVKVDVEAKASAQARAQAKTAQTKTKTTATTNWLAYGKTQKGGGSGGGGGEAKQEEKNNNNGRLSNGISIGIGNGNGNGFLDMELGAGDYLGSGVPTVRENFEAAVMSEITMVGRGRGGGGRGGRGGHWPDESEGQDEDEDETLRNDSYSSSAGGGGLLLPNPDSNSNSNSRNQI